MNKVFYSVVLTAGSIHVNTMLDSPVLPTVIFTFSVMMLLFSAVTVISSILLIIGLCTDNRLLVIPWIVSVVLTTVLDVILSLYLITDSEIDPFFGVLFVADFFICFLNIYCLLCVTSQYQEYLAGRGGRRHVLLNGRLPAIHFEPASCAGGGAGGFDYSHGTPKLTVNMIRNGRASQPSYLLPESGPGSSSSGGQTYSSPFTHHLLSRSSISSTSEISFTSSGGSASSRRGSILMRDRSDSCYARTTALQLAAASSVLGQTDRFVRRLSQLAIEEKSTFPAEEEEEEEEEEDEEVDDDPTNFEIAEIAEIEETDEFVQQQHSMPTTSTSRFRHSPSLFRKTSNVPESGKELTHCPLPPALEEESTTVEGGVENDGSTTS